ncbi:DUF1080 domain-containing protein [Litoribacter ruber]|uniref:DUF1080 domain-containing protein n=1 Tax=Litoribacter ruber TaxID=702568 RepID=A0AAP2CIQ5_9BACT|nr:MULTISPECIES: DUF1080 domain-containing protein [Litoribacter]MBS9522567.1 DUF1080 domain-containing protein [Litoribacter alkaliphilus]MBT0811098.1 DUF1080 domain-containing protein [Litoribacter ruber]
MKILRILGLVGVIWVSLSGFGFNNEDEEGWISLFDGTSLEGWTVNENPRAFQIFGGMLVSHGPRAHLFYDGNEIGQDLKDFELKADIMTFPKASSGIFIHTEYTDKGYPEKGYEIHVNEASKCINRANGKSHEDKTRNTFVKDMQWFTQHIIVKDNTVTIKINDEVVNKYELSDEELNGGTIALQAHDMQSRVYFKNIKIKPL